MRDRKNSSGCCNVPGCDRPHYGLDLCELHYGRLRAARRNGRPHELADLARVPGRSGDVTGLVDELPMSYRQIDYWIRTGRIQTARPKPGSGRRRMFTEPEKQAIAALAERVKLIKWMEADVRSGEFYRRELHKALAEVDA